MKRLIPLTGLLLASCIRMGDADLLIDGHMHPKVGGTFERCTLQVFYDDKLYEQRQIAPAFQVDLTVEPGAEPARIDIACAGSRGTFTTLSGGVKSDGQDIVRLGDIYLD